MGRLDYAANEGDAHQLPSAGYGYDGGQAFKQQPGFAPTAPAYQQPGEEHHMPAPGYGGQAFEQYPPQAAPGPGYNHPGANAFGQYPGQSPAYPGQGDLPAPGYAHPGAQRFEQYPARAPTYQGQDQVPVAGYAHPGAKYPPNPPLGSPYVQAPPYNELQPWTTGIFDCAQDPINCLITLLAPCVTYGQIAAVLDQGTSTCVNNALVYSLIYFCFCAPCFLSYSARSKLRAKFNLPEDPLNDCCTHFFCECCALAQEHREMINRDMNPALGWAAHRHKFANPAGIAMMPPGPAAMSR